MKAGIFNQFHLQTGFKQKHPHAALLKRSTLRKQDQKLVLSDALVLHSGHFLDVLASLRSIAVVQNLGNLGLKPRNPLTFSRLMHNLGIYQDYCFTLLQPCQWILWSMSKMSTMPTML